VKDLMFSDNPVLISRVSALFDAENVEYVVLGGTASLFGGALNGIQSRIMVNTEHHRKALRLIRDLGIEDEVELKL
jgi:hypothetical protein